MTRLYILVFLVFLAGCQQPQPAPTVTSDPDLQRLETELQKAMTQTDMNFASKKIAEYWDRKLVFVEKRMEQKLDEKEQKLFSQSKERWRAYRIEEVRFAADFFDGGSIQPLIANSRYSEITEHRVAELESLYTVALAGSENQK